jgi:hypothetical protein
VTAGPRDEAAHLAFQIDTGNGSVAHSAPDHPQRRSLAADGSSDPVDNLQGDTDITFHASVLILSGRSPELHIDQNGQISRAVNTSVTGVGSGLGSRVGRLKTGTFEVDPITSDDPGNVIFKSGGGGAITGSGGRWEVRDTFQQVKIVHEPEQAMKVQGISVVTTTVDPTVGLSNTATPGLTFAIVRTVAPTLIGIQSLNPDPPDIILGGVIEGPLGTTRLVNVSADIRSAGSQGDPRRPQRRPGRCGGRHGRDRQQHHHGRRRR